MLEITVTDPSKVSKRYNFEQNSVMLGRADGNDVVLENEDVSRYHARLSIVDDRVIIQDLGSTNGLYINAQKLIEGAVQTGDRIQICEFIITVNYKSSDEQAVETAPIDGTIFEAQPICPEKEAATQKNDLLEKATSDSMPVVPISASGVRKTVGDAKSSAEERTDFYWESMQSFLSPVWKFVADESVTEILINGANEIYVERKGSLTKTDSFFSDDQLSAAVLNISQFVGRRVSEEEPYMDARLPDGSRVAVLLPPCSRKGTAIAIRKFAKEKLTLDKLLEFGSISQEMVEFLKACVVLRKNVVVSGGTSSGKTSLLNVLSSLIPVDERILTIEDSAELQLMQEHVLPMETKPADKRGKGEVTIRDLVKASLRMRPDRLIVGEVRGGEAIDLLQAMNTGHSGSMCTIHASSPLQALTRLETLALFSGFELPMRALREQVSSAIDIIVQASRLPDHSRKVTNIAVVDALNEDGSYQVNDVFKFKVEGSKEAGKISGQYKLTGYKPSLVSEFELAGLTDVLKLFKK